MIENSETLPDEQKICVKCGFCCDGSLFLHASLNPGERGSLPLKIEARYFVENGNEYFRLPCLYFSDKCSIYGMKRADVCSSYRCQLLRDFAGGKITLTDAMGTVREAYKVRADLIRQYRELSGSTDPINFMELLHELGKIRKSTSITKGQAMEYDMLLARCNIFEALLIKHFRSAADFEKMMCGRDKEV